MTAERRTSLGVMTGGGVAFLVLAFLLVPWNPVPGGSPPPVDPTSVFTSAQIARAEEFSRWARAWSWSSLALSLAVACFLGFTRHGPRLVERLRGPWWARVVLAVAVLALIGRLVTLPFALLQHRHYADYGLSTQSTGQFLLDVAKSEAIGVVVTGLLMLVLVGSARRWRRFWPVVAGGVLGLFVAAGSFVYPVLVEPAFNSFEPLEEGPLRSQILGLAAEQDLGVDEVLVADASRRTTTLNAYVSGFGATRRVVVYDNLVNDLPRDQALSVVAHELAHAGNDDVVVGTGLGVAGVVFGVGLLGLVVGAASRGTRMRDPRVVPLVAALVAVGTLLASPVESGISRQIETRADVDALDATRDPDAFVEMQRQLAVRSLSDPTPPRWSYFWFGSHPTTVERISLARTLD